MRQEVVIQNDKKYNYALGLLKALMSFEVVLCHYWVCGEDIWKVPLIEWPFAAIRAVAVPAFMIISFYFCAKIFAEKSRDKIRKRMWRLLIPLWGWACIYYIVDKTLIEILELEKSLSIRDFFVQMFLGSSEILNPVLWYQTDIILITMIFWVVHNLFPRKKALICIWILAFISVILQYSEVNYWIFENSRFEIRYTFGRLIEMIPFATMGYSIAQKKCTDYLDSHRLLITIICSFLFVVFVVYSVFGKVPRGFGYNGIGLMISGGTIVILAISFPMEGLHGSIKRFIFHLSKYSLGIYCLHFGVGVWITKIYERYGFTTYSFSESIVIWIVCYMICILIEWIPNKYIKMLIE